MRIICSIVITTLACPALAGPLNPPSGPISPTGRFGPRIEINDTNTPGDADSVYKITEPGSYYLAGNVTGQAMKHGIEIAASGVTLDLMGYELSGLNSSLSGIFGAGFSITVRNGSIRGFGEHGILMDFALASIIEGIQVTFVGGATGAGTGITAGAYTRITGCIVNASQGDCIVGDKGCIVESCIASTSFNGDGFDLAEAAVITSCFANQCQLGHGISAGAGSSIIGCTAEANILSGIRTGIESSVFACSSIGNDQNGFQLGVHCTIDTCSASNNTGSGISASAPHNTIRGCIAYNNGGNGISSTSGSVITDCSAWDNGFNGIVGGSGSVIRSCMALDNTEDGIVCGSSGLVVDCASSGNGEHGIVTTLRATVRDCTSSGNGATIADGAGIYQRLGGESHCRFEGNTLTNNDYGVLVTGTRNIVIRNCASDNSAGEFSIPAGNTIGTIINAAGLNLSNSNSWANISY